MNKNCLLCGVGGQGTVLAAKILSAAAMEKGLSVKSAETIGMAQRGGSVVSHVRIGENVHSPLIPHSCADVVISFEPAEAVRNLCYLKKDGLLITAQKAVMPVTASLGGCKYNGEEMLGYLRTNVNNLCVIDGEKAVAELGSSKVLNIVLLGAAVKSGALGFTFSEIEEIIRKSVKEQFVELNIRALHYSE